MTTKKPTRQNVTTRSNNAETRHRLHDPSTQLLEPLRQDNHPLQALEPDVRERIEQVASECADLFHRSSSAVEGRNGQLSIYIHGRHRLGERKLAALTVVHNSVAA